MLTLISIFMRTPSRCGGRRGGGRSPPGPRREPRNARRSKSCEARSTLNPHCCRRRPSGRTKVSSRRPRRRRRASRQPLGGASEPRPARPRARQGAWLCNSVQQAGARAISLAAMAVAAAYSKLRLRGRALALWPYELRQPVPTAQGWHAASPAATRRQGSSRPTPMRDNAANTTTS